MEYKKGEYYNFNLFGIDFKLMYDGTPFTTGGKESVIFTSPNSKDKVFIRHHSNDGVFKASFTKSEFINCVKNN